MTSSGKYNIGMQSKYVKYNSESSMKRLYNFIDQCIIVGYKD